MVKGSYEFYNDCHTWVSDGGEARWDIMNDLKVIDGWYIKKTTKTSIYENIKKNHKSVFEELCSKGWFKSAYKDLVEDAPKPSPKPETKEEVVNINMDEVVSAIKDLKKTVVDSNRNNELTTALIDGIVSKGKELATEELEKELMVRLDTFIQDTYGALPQRINITKDEIEIEIQGIFHEQFENLLKLISEKIPTMVVGPAGSGKNHTLEQVAETLGLSFYYTGAVTQEYKITGFIDANGTYHETEFFKAFTSGGIFMLDEIDASSPDVLVLLNGAIANRYFDFPTGREIAHEDFRVVCAGNTFGTGADIVYVGRNVLDGATLDRFVQVEMDYCPEVEKSLCKDEELYEFLLDVRNSTVSNRIRHIVGMRTSINSFKCLNLGLDKQFILKSVIFKGVGVDDLSIIKGSLSGSGSWYRELHELLRNLR